MAYDLLMLGLLAITTLRGSAKGMAWQLAGIAARGPIVVQHHNEVVEFGSLFIREL